MPNKEIKDKKEKKEKIVIKNLNFYYNDKQVIHDLNMTVPENEIFSIIGPANSGNSPARL